MKKSCSITGFLVAILLLSSCSSGTGSNLSNGSTTSTTSPLVPAKNPITELDALAKRVNAVDYSRLSINHDGIFAVVLRDKQIGDVATVATFTFWRWDGKVWNDVSGAITDRPLDIDFFEPRARYGASSVTSYDYNQDGIVDFLVEFNEKDMGLNHPAGAILSSRGGTWHWESFMYLDGSISKAGSSVVYDSETGELAFRDYPSDRAGYQADLVTLNWDSQREMFIADMNSYRYTD